MGEEEGLGHNYMVNNHVDVSWRGEGEGGRRGREGKGRERAGSHPSPPILCVYVSHTLY